MKRKVVKTLKCARDLQMAALRRTLGPRGHTSTGIEHPGSLNALIKESSVRLHRHNITDSSLHTKTPHWPYHHKRTYASKKLLISRSRHGQYIKEVWNRLKEGVYWRRKEALYFTKRNRSTRPSGTNTLEFYSPVCVRVKGLDCVGEKSVLWTRNIIEHVR